MKRQILSSLFLLTIFCAMPIFAQENSSKDTPYFNRFRLKNINLLCACDGGDEREKLKVLTGNIWKILSKNASLSFSLNEGEKMAAPPGVMRLGDIVISYPIARLEAARDEMLVDDKIDELVLHGMTHLLGTHHE